MSVPSDPFDPDPAVPNVLLADSAGAIERAAELLRAGRLVAFPTETVYGLGANAFDPDAVRRIFAAKDRPAFNPLIVHLADRADLARVARRVPAVAARLAAAFWPGPLTLVLPRADTISDVVTAGLTTVGVRVPAHPVARALIAAAGVPIAAPSANLYTRISPTTAAHVTSQLGDLVDLVLDGGPSGVGIESTVVDVSGDRPVLLRPGGVTAAELERVVGTLLRPSTELLGDEARPAPGMLERHYAPRARLIPFGNARPERARMQHQIETAIEQGKRCGLLTFGDAGGVAATVVITMPSDPAGYARDLFAALHRIDDAGCEFAFVERIPGGPEWEAIADRLRRAGHG